MLKEIAIFSNSKFETFVVKEVITFLYLRVTQVSMSTKAE